MNSDQFDKEFDLEQVINILRSDILLERLGSDYDSDGIPYWDKWEGGTDGIR